ncbi:hypothetical protein [Vallitalea sp.]|jgi:hypothetical protein|uniref:hypothetical protein n=1 Tax=Vallitalea sp. TaxID=1882829 RepID=UPI0025EC9C99|nr:hypothetical protein [Vallitalea sp.]MCT4686385.1 hypothetical protein [Vallitalea sp.]
MRTLKVTFTIITIVLVLCSCESLKNETNNQINSPQESYPTDYQQSENISEKANIDTIPMTKNNDLVNLLTTDKLELSDNLIRYFFEYDTLHSFELTELPTFNSSNQPDWDQLTFYIYHNFAQYHNYVAELTKENFRNTVNQFYGELKYQDKESLYLEYSNGNYTYKPGDTIRTGYHRLTSISKDKNGLYTATFDRLILGEVEAADPYEIASANIKAIRDAAGTKDCLQTKEFNQTLLNIFLNKNYHETLDMTEIITIQFILTDNTDFPFQYKSCDIIRY